MSQRMIGLSAMRPARLVSDVLDELRRKLRDRFGDELRDVVLFGSYARGEAGADSDVDVLVVLDHAEWAHRRTVIDAATDLGLEHDLLISPTVVDRATYERWSRQRRPLVVDIERDGVRI